MTFNPEERMGKKLYRSRTDSMIGGVCGGLAEYFNVDSTLVRLAAVALTLAGGSGVLAYLIFWFVVPQKSLSLTTADMVKEKKEETATAASDRSDSNTGMLFVGVILTVLGFAFLVGNFISFAWFSFRKLWPLILIAIGMFIVLKGSEAKTRES
jgi:phage shock protein PspC (stress-responsive transcriptional regulator)